MTVEALPCPCGGKLIERHHSAYSTDSSFDYVGCDQCDLSLIEHEKLDDDTVQTWNDRVRRK